MSMMASQISSLMIVYSIVYLGSDQRKHQCSTSLACEGNSPVTSESPPQRPVTWKMLSFDDNIMSCHKLVYTLGPIPRRLSLTTVGVALPWRMIIKSGHIFSHVTIAQLSWHLRICNLAEWLDLDLNQKDFAQDFKVILRFKGPEIF